MQPIDRSAASVNPGAADFGSRLGKLVATSETQQKAICGISLVGGVVAGFFSDGMFMLIPAILGFVGIAYGLTKIIPALHERFELFERGIQLRLYGKAYSLPFEQIESYSVQYEPHYSQHGQYIGSRVKMKFRLLDRPESIRCDMESYPNRKSYRILDQALTMVREHVQSSLTHRLESEGELEWSHDVSLTMDSVCVRVGDKSREIAIEDIERYTVQDEMLVLWKREGHNPFVSIPTTGMNFQPIAGIFASLHELYGESQASQGYFGVPQNETVSPMTMSPTA